MKRIILLLGIVMLFSVISVSATWWDTDWNNRVQINISNSNVDSDLTDFPHLIKLNSSIMNFSSALSNGEDIRFLNATEDGELDFEIEKWDLTGEQAEIWVRIPTLSSSQVTTLYLYYNNPIASDGQNMTDVWTSDYYTVQHLNEESGLTAYDSTGAYNGTLNGPVTNNKTGKVDGAYDFDGGNNYVTTLNINSDITWVASIWIKLNTTDNRMWNDDEHVIFDTDSTNFRCGYDDGVSEKKVVSTTAVVADTWYYVVCDRNITGGLKIYVDGVLEASNGGLTGSAYDRGGTPNIGCSYNLLTCINGTADEFRLSKTTRSSAWYKAEYYSQINSMNSFGDDYFNTKGQMFKLSPVEGSTNSYLNLNFTVRSDSSQGHNITNVTIIVYDPNNATETTQFFDYPVSNQTSVTSTFLYNITGSYFGNETWRWSSDMCVSDGDCSTINADNFSGETNNTFFIDSIGPSINLSSPTLEGSTSAVNLIYSYTELNPDSCWYSVNGGSNVSHTCGTTSSTFPLSPYGPHNITFYMNDTFGNSLGQDSRNFTIIENIQNIYSNPVIEANIETIKMIINDTEGINPSMTLTYDGTNYSGTLESTSGTNRTYSVTLIAPSIPGPTGTVDFNWTMQGTVSGKAGSYTYPTITQNINFLEIDNCTSYNFTILNYTLVDEATRSASGLTNVTIESYVTLTNPLNETANWTFATTEPSENLAICMPEDAIANTTYTLGAVTRYFSADHVVEYHYIDSYNLSNANSLNITLHDLEDTQSTSFLMVFKDEVFLPVEGAIIDALRFYVGDGEYISVEHGKTNDQGETRLHLVTEDVKYIFIVRKEGEILYTSPEYLALCQSAPCQINLYASSTEDEHTNFTNRYGLSYSITTNETARSISVLFSTTDGSPATVSINATLYDAYLNQTGCYDSLTSSAGTLSCVIPSNMNNTRYYVELFKDGDIIEFFFFDLRAFGFSGFGYAGLIMTFFLIITLVMMGVRTGSAMITLGTFLLGLVVAGSLLWYTGGSVFGTVTATAWIIGAIFIIGWKIAERRLAG